MADARAAADSVKRTYRDSRKADGSQTTFDEDLADAIQGAILGSILPFVTESSDRGTGKDDRHHRGGALALVLGIGIGVGIAAWARRDDVGDSPLPEDEEWELVNGPSTRVAKAAINETLDRADSILRRLAKTTAETMGAAVGTVADAAGPTAELVTDKLRVARQKATSEVIRTLDDLDAVWDDESAPPSTTTRPTATKPTPRKPVARKPAAARTPSTARKPSSTKKSRPTEGNDAGR